MDKSSALANVVLEASELTTSFAGRDVVNGVTLRIARSTVFGLIGPNGAGKTTLIRTLLGLIPVTSGHAVIAGSDIRHDIDSVRRKVGYVPSVQSMYRWMTVGEVIGFCREFRSGWNDELCESLLERLQLEVSKRVGHLSHGMQTKLGLLLALAFEPELLILDEPTTGLDPIVREEFLEPVLSAVCDRGCTVLFSSHMIEDVERLANHVGILHKGRLIVNSSVAELLERTRRVRATLRDGRLPQHVPPGTIWQSVDRREWLLTISNFTEDTERIHQARFDVQEMTVNEIEDAFFQLTIPDGMLVIDSSGPEVRQYYNNSEESSSIASETESSVGQPLPMLVMGPSDSLGKATQDFFQSVHLIAIPLSILVGLLLWQRRPQSVRSPRMQDAKL